jgi:hypothetical protein
MEARIRGGANAKEQTAVAVSPLRLPSKALVTIVTPPARSRMELRNVASSAGTAFSKSQNIRSFK